MSEKFKEMNECTRNSVGMGSFCESCCGVPFQPLWCDGRTWYCLACASNGDLTKAEVEQIEKMFAARKCECCGQWKRQL